MKNNTNNNNPLKSFTLLFKNSDIEIAYDKYFHHNKQVLARQLMIMTVIGYPLSILNNMHEYLASQNLHFMIF